jgi:hypothetical protein
MPFLSEAAPVTPTLPASLSEYSVPPAPTIYEAHEAGPLVSEVRRALCSFSQHGSGAKECYVYNQDGSSNLASEECLLRIDEPGTAPEIQYTPDSEDAHIFLKITGLDPFVKIAYTTSHYVGYNSDFHNSRTLAADNQSCKLQQEWNKKQLMAIILFENDYSTIAFNKEISDIHEFETRAPGPLSRIETLAATLLEQAEVPYVPYSPDRVCCLLGMAAIVVERLLHMSPPRWEKFAMPCTVKTGRLEMLPLPQAFFVHHFGGDISLDQLDEALRCMRLYSREGAANSYQVCTEEFKGRFRTWLTLNNGRRVASLVDPPLFLLTLRLMLLTEEIFRAFGVQDKAEWNRWSIALGAALKIEHIVIFIKEMMHKLSLQYPAPSVLVATPLELVFISMTEGELKDHPFICKASMNNSRPIGDMFAALKTQGLTVRSFHNDAAIGTKAPWDELFSLSQEASRFVFVHRYEVKCEHFILVNTLEPDENLNVAIRFALRFASEHATVTTPCEDQQCWCSPFMTDRTRLKERALLCIGRQILRNWAVFFPKVDRPPQYDVAEGKAIPPPPKKAPPLTPVPIVPTPANAPIPHLWYDDLMVGMETEEDKMAGNLSLYRTSVSKGTPHEVGRSSPLIPDDMTDLEAMLIIPTNSRQEKRVIQNTVTQDNFCVLLDLANLILPPSCTSAAGLPLSSIELLNYVRAITRGKVYGYIYGTLELCVLAKKVESHLDLAAPITTSASKVPTSANVTYNSVVVAMRAQLEMMNSHSQGKQVQVLHITSSLKHLFDFIEAQMGEFGRQLYWDLVCEQGQNASISIYDLRQMRAFRIPKSISPLPVMLTCQDVILLWRLMALRRAWYRTRAGVLSMILLASTLSCQSSILEDAIATGVVYTPDFAATMDSDKLLGNVQGVRAYTDCPSPSDFPALNRWSDKSGWNVLGFFVVHPATNMALIKESLRTLLVHLYADIHVADTDCFVLTVELSICNRPMLMIRLPNPSIAATLFSCVILAPFWLVPYYGSQQTYQFERMRIARPTPETPPPAATTVLNPMDRKGDFLLPDVYHATGILPIITGPFKLKNSAVASVLYNGNTVWAPAIKISPLFGLERAAIWTMTGWAPLILSEEMWKTLRTVDSQVSGLPRPPVAYDWHKYHCKSFLVSPQDGPLQEAAVKLSPLVQTSDAATKWFKNRGLAESGFKLVTHWGAFHEVPIKYLITEGTLDSSRTLCWERLAGKEHPRPYYDSAHKGFEWLDANKRMVETSQHNALGPFMQTLDWFQAFKVAMSWEARRRNEEAGVPVVEVRNILSLIKSYPTHCEKWWQFSETHARLPTVEDASTTDWAIEGGTGDPVPITLWVRNTGMGFPLIVSSQAFRLLQDKFQVMAVFMTEPDAFCSGLLHQVATLAFPNIHRDDIRLWTTTEGLSKVNESLQVEFPYKRYMTDGCTCDDSTYAYKQGKGPGLHGPRSLMFFSDHRFLADTCAIVGPQGYASFSEFTTFHEGAKQDEEEMVACKGPFFVHDACTQGRQRRARTLFLYPPTKDPPLHPTQPFATPAGWEWPMPEAISLFYNKRSQLRQEITASGVAPASLRTWIVEVGIPCFFGKETWEGKGFDRLNTFEQWSVLSHQAAKDGVVHTAGLEFELDLFGVPEDFKRFYTNYDPDGGCVPCLTPGRCGVTEAHCWKCCSKLSKMGKAWDIPSHAQLMIRHLRIWHASVAVGQHTLVGHGLPIHICGVDCPYKRYSSTKFDAIFHASYGVRTAAQAQRDRQAWDRAPAAIPVPPATTGTSGGEWYNYAGANYGAQEPERWETDLYDRADPAAYPWRISAAANADAANAENTPVSPWTTSPGGAGSRS